MEARYVSFRLEHPDHDRFKEEVIRTGTNDPDSELERMVSEYWEYIKEESLFVADFLGCSALCAEDSRVIRFDSGDGFMLCRRKSPRVIHLKTRSYEGGDFMRPPAEQHRIGIYDFYDVYGLQIIAESERRLREDIVPFFRAGFTAVAPDKDYMASPHENGYQAIHLRVRRAKPYFVPVIDVHLHTERTYCNANTLQADYYDGKYECGEDYFSRRSVKGTGK